MEAAPGRLVTFRDRNVMHAFTHAADTAHADGYRYMIGPLNLDPLALGEALAFEAVGNGAGQPPTPCTCRPTIEERDDLVTCKSTGDPHVTTWNGENFNFYAVGW